MLDGSITLSAGGSHTLKGGVVFEHVAFGYDKDNPVLRDVSFVLDPGETVAVVGHTGAGKTTLISLLMRFYDVQKGAIRIDGVDIKDMDLKDLRSRFGVVLQDPFLFSGTVAGNIKLGTGWIEDADVERAAEEAATAAGRG